jgi:hypothetical protein
MAADDEPAGVPAFLEFRLHTAEHGSFFWRPELTTAMQATVFEVADLGGVPVLRVPLPVDEHTADRCRCRITKLEYSTVAVHFDTMERLVRIITLFGAVTMTEDDWFALVSSAASIRARARKANP